MNILVVHNSYREPGGEDVVVDQEVAMLRDAGHRVVEYRRSNTGVNDFGVLERMKLAKHVISSKDSKEQLTGLIAKERPDVVHIHNTFFMISPSIYSACAEAGVPVIRTLQNYRLLCPAATFFRAGATCEKCLGRTPPWPSVAYSCYRDSRTQTAVVAGMLTVHRLLKTWQKQVDMYIAVTNFMREKYIEGGFSSDRIVVKPNTIYSDPGVCQGERDYVMFAGRLAGEKGVHTLISAWSGLREIPIKILGDGTLIHEARASDKILPTMQFLGWQPHEDVFNLLKGARFLVVPSEWYEGFPMTIVESFACGVPVIASRIGSIQEIVKDGETGLMFAAGDAGELRRKVEWAWTHKEEMQRMGHEARREYERKYSPVQNYKTLMEIYERVIENHRRKRT
jgi:glycosyltransferase involved in cell wall biosynthesis